MSSHLGLTLRGPAARVMTDDSENMTASPLVTARNYLDLTKPRLLPMVLFTGLPVLGMAAGGWPDASLCMLILLAIGLAAASANTLNAYIERDTDA